ncbi:MAG: substrate-binding domain-containing protein [Christensenellaceae bacterium]|nr:substrate-binding domain-containing protein [Christensenellaceae bacterium]
MKKKLTTILALLLVVFILAGCSPKAMTDPQAMVQPAEKPRIGVSLLTTQLEYYISLFESFRICAEKANVDLVIYDSKWDRYKQSADIRKMMDDGVDAIICAPTDPETIRKDLLAAQEAGITVIVEMTYVDDSLTLIRTDQLEGGRLAGRFAGEWINRNYNGNCDVAIISYPFLENTVQREQGFAQGLNEVCPNAKIVAVKDGQAKSEISYQETLEVLSEHPNVRCIFGINDDTARGINKAFHFTQLPTANVCVIGFDADVSTQRLIDSQNEYLKASVMADPQIIAQACIDSALWKINNKTSDQRIDISSSQYMYTGQNSSAQN